MMGFKVIAAAWVEVPVVRVSEQWWDLKAFRHAGEQAEACSVSEQWWDLKSKIQNFLDRYKTC